MVDSVEIKIPSSEGSHYKPVLIKVTSEGELSATCSSCHEPMGGAVDFGYSVEMTEVHASCQRCGDCVVYNAADLGDLSDQSGMSWFCPADESQDDESGINSFGCEQLSYMER